MWCFWHGASPVVGTGGSKLGPVDLSRRCGIGLWATPLPAVARPAFSFKRFLSVAGSPAPRPFLRTCRILRGPAATQPFFAPATEVSWPRWGCFPRVTYLIFQKHHTRALPRDGRHSQVSILMSRTALFAPLGGVYGFPLFCFLLSISNAQLVLAVPAQTGARPSR